MLFGSTPKSCRPFPGIVKMFKRVDKRRRKKEEEEKLGLDEEVKEILGIQDTDSEESESDSDDGEEESVADEEMNSGEEDEDDDEEDDEEEDPSESVTVGQALKDPLYNVSVLPDVKACIVCPGKLLKSVKMVQLHRTSNACTLSLIYTQFISSPFLKFSIGPYTSL